MCKMSCQQNRTERDNETSSKLLQTFQVFILMQSFVEFVIEDALDDCFMDCMLFANLDIYINVGLSIYSYGYI